MGSDRRRKEQRNGHKNECDIRMGDALSEAWARLGNFSVKTIKALIAARNAVTGGMEGNMEVAQ